MNKNNIILSLGLIQALALSSCVEEKIVNEGLNKVDIQLSDASFNAILSEEPASRINWINNTFIWNAEDKISVWNRNLGLNHMFTLTENAESSKSVFSGKTVLTNGHKLIAIYPYKEDTRFNNIGSFVLPDTTLQAGINPELSTKCYMYATSQINEGRIPDLYFNPLTSLFNIQLKNISGNEIKLKYLTISADEDVFPSSVSINENGVITTLSNMTKSVTIDFSEQPLADQAIINASINILPTIYGETMLMNKNTKISISAKVWTGEKDTEVILLDATPLTETDEILGLDLSSTSYQLTAGSKYDLNFDLDYHFKVPEEGYVYDEINETVHIYNKAGLINWRNDIVASSPQANVILEKDYFENNELIFEGNDVWEPIEFFSGVLDANGIIIKGLKVSNYGIFKNNNGTIKNLILESPLFSSNVTQPSGFITSVNNGIIENCIIKNIQATITKPVNFGSIAGQNAQPGTINNCQVNGGTLHLNLNGGDSGSSNFGGLVGENYGGTGTILASKVIDVTIDHPSNSYGASNVGGLVGYNNIGKIKASYSDIKMNINCSAQTGGLVGTNANGTILASYAVTSINGNGTNNTGGLIGFNNGNTTIVTSSYAMPTSTMNHSKFGLLIGNNAGNVVTTYVVSTSNIEAIKTGSTNVGYEPKLNDVTTLISKMLEMNLEIEKIEPELGWNFKKNEDTETQSKYPLIHQYGVPVPGFDGDDFEDGDNI